MKPRFYLVASVVFLFVVGLCATSRTAAQSNNSIFGVVFDAQSRRPVGDVYVELLDELGSSLRRARVEPSGRFVFNGLSAGRFTVRVLPLGTNYHEESQEATLVSLPRGAAGASSDTIYLEFYLRLDPRRANAGLSGVTGTVFAQEVPEAARKLYKKAVAELDEKKDAGLETLVQALAEFPNYYDALDRLGNEYVRRERFAEAAPYLVRAIDVNQRSFSSFYALGIACYRLKVYGDAIQAFRAAAIINPQSLNAQLWHGISLRVAGDYEKAEKVLLQAKALAEKNAPVGEIHWQLALLYEKTARFGLSADELERYLKIEPNVPNAAQIRKLIEQLRAKAK